MLGCGVTVRIRVTLEFRDRVRVSFRVPGINRQPNETNAMHYDRHQNYAPHVNRSLRGT